MAHWDETKSGDASTVFDSDVKGASAATVLQADAGTSVRAATGRTIEKGAELLNIYRVESDAVQGGMGKVWRVRHTGWDVDLAMKQPKAELFRNEQQKEDFIHECEAWINLGLHPQIVSCYYVREIGGVPSIFAEWMEGGSLKEWIRSGRLYEGDVEDTLKRILDIAIQFARGLHYAHDRGLIHQDVKPDNLLMTQKGEAKVADFGISRARAVLTAGDRATNAPADATLVSGSSAYTPAYCSPEQVQGETLSRRTDIYSWAVSVLEMFLGERLWQSGVVAGKACEDYFSLDMRAAMPQRMKDLLKQCFSVNPDERPHDFAEIDAILLQIYREVAGGAYPTAISEAAAETPDSLNNRALSLLDLGKAKEAEQLWQLALEKDSEHLDSSYNYILYAWRNSRGDDRNLLDTVDSHRLREPEKVAALLEQIKKEQYGIDVLRSLGGDRTNSINPAAATADGHTVLAYLPVQDAFQAYDARTGERTGLPIENDRGLPFEIRFTRRGNGFWVLHEDSLALRSFPDGEGICEITQEDFPVIAFGIDQRDKYLVTLSWYKRKLESYGIPTVTTWDIQAGEKVTENKIDIAGNPCLSPDGEYFIARSAVNANLELRHSLTGKKIADFTAGREAVIDFDVNDDFSQMVSVDKEHVIRIWNIKKRRPAAEIKLVPEVGGHESVKILRGSRHAIVTNDTKDHFIRIIDMTTGRIVRTVTGDEMNWSRMTTAHPLYSSNEFLIVKEGAEAEVWRLNASRFRSGLSVSKIFKTELRIEQEATFREHLALAHAHLEKKQIREALSHLDLARAVPGFEYDGKAIALRNALAPYCRMVGNRKVIFNESYSGHRSPVLFSAISTDGRLAVSGCGGTRDRMASLWKAETGDFIKPLEDTDYCKAAAFCDENTFLIGNYKSVWRASVYTTETEMFDGTKRTRYLHKMLEEYACGGIVSFIRYFPHNRTFASASESLMGPLYALKLWTLEENNHEMNLYKGDFRCVDFNHDGSKAYLALKEPKIIVLETKTASQKEFAAVGAHALSVSFDGRYIAAATDDGVVIFSVAGGCIASRITDESRVTALSFVHAGPYLVCTYEDGKLAIIDTHGRVIRKTTLGQNAKIVSLSVSHDDLFVLTGGVDGKIYRWDLDWIYEPILQ